jgi:hypothetical protein
MLPFWTALHNNPDSWSRGWADVPRKEDYFALYHSAGGGIGTIRASFAEAIVRHYTYLKMSRDAAQGLKLFELMNKNESRGYKKEVIFYVVHLLSLSILWGFISLLRMGRMATVSEKKLLDHAILAYNACAPSNLRLQDLVSTLPGSAPRDLAAFFGEKNLRDYKPKPADVSQFDDRVKRMAPKKRRMKISLHRYATS